MTRHIAEMTTIDVKEHLIHSPLAVIPFGSVEQHGPHMPNGTDTLAAELIAGVVAEQLDGLMVPFGPYGVTPIHAGHAGTVSLTRSTFENLLTEICHELIDMGARRLVYVNWHEGNISSLDGVAMEIQNRNKGVYVVTSQACYVAQRVYASEGGELTHGGGIEAMAVMAARPEQLHVDRVEAATRSKRAESLDAMRRGRETYGYITDVTEIDPDGWYGNPVWATPESADQFAGRVADEITRAVREILALRRDDA